MICPSGFPLKITKGFNFKLSEQTVSATVALMVALPNRQMVTVWALQTNRVLFGGKENGQGVSSMLMMKRLSTLLLIIGQM